METGVAQLTLEEDEEEELIFSRDAVNIEVEDYNLCVVGYLMTNKGFNFAALESRLAELWQPGRGVTIEDLGGNLLLFRFYHEIDLRRMMELGPWHYDANLIVMRELKAKENPRSVDLFEADFWVQVHKLPPGFFTTTVGKALGNFIGSFLELEAVDSRVENKSPLPDHGTPRLPHRCKSWHEVPKVLPLI
ncbi:hypothetical protein LINPERHAP1_LOCUS8741 [Linum perenne]